MTTPFILGAGVSGLAAGLVSGLRVYEGSEYPGGICSSYYMRAGRSHRFHLPPRGGGYRFELGGGHWIWGTDVTLRSLLSSFVALRFYSRRAAVYFPDPDLFIPYPIQYHLKYLGGRKAAAALEELTQSTRSHQTIVTMADWLTASFGPTLCEMFFDPFHEKYTAGLSKHIAPQDSFKSPIDISLAVQGALGEVPPVGYNPQFMYPTDGLDALARRMASRCDIQYGKRVVKIDPVEKVLYFVDGEVAPYTILVSTLPLNQMMDMTGITLDEAPCPHTSVLVINIGATKGPRCPKEHWIYIPKSRAGFHRVGFYSNVDDSFLLSPRSRPGDRVAIYVETAYPQGQLPSATEASTFCRTVAEELRDWQWIRDVEIADPTFIEVAYTWSWPGSTWREKALTALREHDIYQVGRFARWVCQGIADSLREGLEAGNVFLRSTSERAQCEQAATSRIEET